MPIQTDFYELYWAYLMQGTVWAHIVAWHRMLMFRLPFGAHIRIQCLWAALWGLCAVVFYLAYQNKSSSLQAASLEAAAVPSRDQEPCAMRATDSNAANQCAAVIC